MNVETNLWIPSGWEDVGSWGQLILATIYRMDKQSPTTQHRELYSVSCDKP